MRRDEDKRLNKILVSMAVLAAIVASGILYAGHVAVEQRKAFYAQILQQEHTHAVTVAKR